MCPTRYPRRRSVGGPRPVDVRRRRPTPVYAQVSLEDARVYLAEEIATCYRWWRYDANPHLLASRLAALEVAQQCLEAATR